MNNDARRDKLQNQYSEVELLIGGLKEDFILKRHRPEKWLIHENLAHLGRYQEVFQSRINKILTDPTPVFNRYSAELDDHFIEWTAKDHSTIIRHSKEFRMDMSEFLLSLSETQLSRQGIHSKLGPMNIEEWIQVFLLHESHHIYAIFGL